nr:MAG TPA: hypothetical protein [Caudoviricetes sp.]
MLLFQKLHRHHCLCHLRRHLQRLANPQTYIFSLLYNSVGYLKDLPALPI